MDDPPGDVVDFGGDRSRFRLTRGRLAAAAAIVLAIAGGLYWSHHGSHAVAPARHVTEPILPSRPPELITTNGGWGSTYTPGRPNYVLHFDVQPPTMTFESVTATAGTILGLADPRVYLVPTAAVDTYDAYTSFDDVQSMRSLPAGVAFSVIIVGRRFCDPVTRDQPLIVHIAYTTSSGVSSLDITGAPVLTAAQWNSDMGGCPSESPPP